MCLIDKWWRWWDKLNDIYFYDPEKEVSLFKKYENNDEDEHEEYFHPEELMGSEKEASVQFGDVTQNDKIG